MTRFKVSGFPSCEHSNSLTYGIRILNVYIERCMFLYHTPHDTAIGIRGQRGWTFRIKLPRSSRTSGGHNERELRIKIPRSFKCRIRARVQALTTREGSTYTSRSSTYMPFTVLTEAETDGALCPVCVGNALSTLVVS
jgi:hypothetical protein